MVGRGSITRKPVARDRRRVPAAVAGAVKRFLTLLGAGA